MHGSKEKTQAGIADDVASIIIKLQMHTSVPNFNFLARLVSEIWGGRKIKSGSCSWFPQTPLAQGLKWGRVSRVGDPALIYLPFICRVYTRSLVFTALARIITAILQINEGVMDKNEVT